METKVIEIKSLIEQNDLQQLQDVLRKMVMQDIIEVLKNLSDEEKAVTFTILNEALSIKIFKIMDADDQKRLIKSLPHEKAAQLLNNLPPDDRTAFFEELPSKVVKELIRRLNPQERSVTLSLLGYPENSVGRLMTPDYITAKENWTIQQLLDNVRQYGHDSETVDVFYVIDQDGKLLDDVRLREVLFVSPNKKISDVMDNRYLKLHVHDEEEKAIGIFGQNNRFALPVVDDNNVLIGIVTIDDVLRLAEEETTEDIQKIGGVDALEEPYTRIPFFTLMKKRAGWLVILFLGEMLTATAMAYFQDEIAKAVVLALFIPLIISSGGNSGSQASTLVIRAMALGEVTLRDWWHIMQREFLSGLFLGTVLGTIGFCRVSLWTLFTDIYGPHWLLVALTVFLSLIGVVMWGTLSGSMLPLLLKKLGADPAASSAPFVATLVDVTGLVIYFTIAFFVFRGTLL